MLNTHIFFYKKTKILLSLLLIFSLTACDGLFSSDNWDSDDDECDEDTTTVSFKQVAYWIEDETDDQADDLEDVDYSQLTHIIYGYISVNADGTLVGVNAYKSDGVDGKLTNSTYEDNLEYIVANASSYAKVLISIGGSSSADNLETIAKDDDLTDDLIDNIVVLVDKYGLDGVDLSWQYPEDSDEGEYFEDLVKALSDKLWGSDYLFTIEVVSGLDDSEDYAEVITSDTFDYVDFVNVRAYENEDGNNAITTEDLVDSMSYWTGRCLIQNKMVVGIPFESSEVSSTSTSYTYAEIIDKKDEDLDYVCGDGDYDTADYISIGGNKYYYNGILTVIDKTDYAQVYAGGVMMMSLDQDTYDDSLDDNYSLLYNIYQAIEDDDYENTLCD